MCIRDRNNSTRPETALIAPPNPESPRCHIVLDHDSSGCGSRTEEPHAYVTLSSRHPKLVQMLQGGLSVLAAGAELIPITGQCDFTMLLQHVEHAVPDRLEHIRGIDKLRADPLDFTTRRQRVDKLRRKAALLRRDRRIRIRSCRRQERIGHRSLLPGEQDLKIGRGHDRTIASSKTSGLYLTQDRVERFLRSDVEPPSQIVATNPGAQGAGPVMLRQQ